MTAVYHIPFPRFKSSQRKIIKVIPYKIALKKQPVFLRMFLVLKFPGTISCLLVAVGFTVPVRNRGSATTQ